VDAQPAVEREIAVDLVRRGLLISPVVVLVGGLIGGWSGAASAAIGLGLVCLNFGMAAGSMSWAARISPTAVGGVAAGGFIVRMAIIVAALLLFRHVSWINFPVLGFTLVAGQVGLLFWETRHVSMTLAAPGLRPRGRIQAGDE
jgi:hypothetical protein